MGRILEDDEESLYRQIPTNHFVDDNRPSSEAFKPTRREEGKMSVDRSACVTPRNRSIGLRRMGITRLLFMD